MNGFDRVSYKTHVFKRDFTDEKQVSVAAAFIKTVMSAAGITPVKIYDVNGAIYAYCADKTLKKYTGGAFATTSFTSNVVPHIVPIILNGTDKTLFIGDTAAIEGGSAVSGVPYGASCALCAGRLFIADGNKIKFSEEFDFTDFSVGLDFGGFIGLDDESGDALFLAEDAGNIYVVASHAVYQLQPYGEQFEFVFKKLSTFCLNVKAGTIAKAGNKICFLSGNDLCVLCGGKVKKVGGTLADFGAYSFGAAGVTKGVYHLFVQSGGKNYAYIYDTVGEREIINDIGEFSLLGAYAKKTGDDYLYEPTLKTNVSVGGSVYGGEYDFGSCAKKSVCKIEAHITGSAEIVVSGEGVFRAALTEKCNRASCYVHGRIFNIGFENASENFKINKLVIYYVIHGE